MAREDQLPWGTQSGTDTDEKIEWDRHDTEKGSGGHSGYDWEKPSKGSRYDINPDQFSNERGELFGDEDGGQEP